jgi:CheY-like chemotaxis protein
MATILCIDDDPNILELQDVLLGGKGYCVLRATDGRTGIALSRKHAIDVVVLDFNMPGIDGTEVAQALMAEQPNLPAVIWSGCPADIPQSLHWFADAVLHKGDGPERLLATLEKLINCKKAPARQCAKGKLTA